MKRDTQTPTRKRQWQKVFGAGEFNLFREKTTPTLFEVSWKRSNGSYGRRRFSAETIERAVERAPIVAGLEPDTPKLEGVTMLDAFAQALQESKRGTRTRKDWKKAQERFMLWLAEKHPDCVYWQLLTRAIVKQYLAETLDGKSPNHKRLTLQPLTQTGLFMEREYQAPNVTAGLGIGTKLIRETPMVYLTDVVAFVNWLREHNPRLEAGAALAGLVGLRLQEALRLTWDKVDLDRGLIEVSGDVKTPWSNRVIPVAERVVETLCRAWRRQERSKLFKINAPVVVSLTGCSYAAGVRSYCNYSRELSGSIQKWNAKVDWQPKDLRNAIPTFCAMHGLSGDVSEMYIGHAPKSVTARHYIPRLASASLGETKALERMMAAFKLQVVEPINQALVAGKTPKILNIFEREPILEDREKAGVGA